MARIESSPAFASKVAWGYDGRSVLVGLSSAIHFSRGPLISLTLSWP
jgi:hypothetical protein